MKNKVFGIDIGATKIKVVWLDKEKDGYKLNSVMAVPTPEKGLLSESPLDQEEMAQTLLKLLSDSSISVRAANVALPENQVYTRVIEMPVLSDKELVSAIYWEAEQYIPVSLTSVTLDYKVLRRPDPSEPNPKMDVLLIGAPTVLIDKYEKILATAGITINALETEILSAIRAIVIGQGKFPSSLIVNIGALHTSFAIVKNNILVFTYSLPTGGIALSRAIAADFGFSLPQAEEYKKVYGLSDKNFEGKIGKASQPVLESILSEAKKAIVYYNGKYITDPIKQIVITGGTAKLPGISGFFASSTSIETVIANPWKVLVPQEIPKEILDDAPSYTVGVGLAMREYE